MNKAKESNILLPDVLTINASDSTGEAGIVADIGTISALRGRPLAAMTSIISQDGGGACPHVSNLPTQLVAEQIRSALQKARPLAVKVGFVCEPETIEHICPIVKAIPRRVMVPSIIDSTGNRLLSPLAMDLWTRHLLPLADLMILKVCEAEAMLRCKILTDNEMLRAAERLCQLGAKAVMLRGAQIREGYLTTLLMHAEGHEFFSSRNMDTWQRHGIAGAMSTAIATRYAFGDSTQEAVSNAHSYIHSHLVYSISTGRGTPAMRSADIYNAFLSLLTQHYAMAHDVAFYAERLCVSTRYLQDVTNKMAEKKPKQIITDYLLQEACSMLKGTRLTVQQISQRLGFTSQAHFSRFFSREQGMSPQAYRLK